jgi:hypothetical protein
MTTNNPLATQTIMGVPVEETYRVIETMLPDGTVFKQLFHHVINEENGELTWQLVDEKLKAIDDKRKEMDARFKDTAKSKPSNWDPPQTETLKKKEQETDETLGAGGITRINMSRVLMLNLGDPQKIIDQKGLDSQRIAQFKKEPRLLTTLCMMAYKHDDIIDKEGRRLSWRTASTFLKPAYPDSNPDA